MKAKIKKCPSITDSKAVESAFIRAGKAARKIARMYGTPVYFLRDGKVVAEKP